MVLALATALVFWRMSGDPWQEAANHIEAEASNAPLVVISPAMHNREVRRFPGHAVIAVDRLGRRDTREYDEVWVLSEGAPTEPILRGLRQFTSESKNEMDGLVLTRFVRSGGSP